MHSVLARQRGQAEVGDDEPLRRKRAAIVIALGRGAGVFPWARRDHIDARLELADRVENRKFGHDILVEIGGDVHRAAPDLDAVLIGDFSGARTVDAFEEIVALNGGQQVAVADPVDVERDLGGVDRDERRALLSLARQHVILAGEMHLGRAILHVDFVIGVFQQGLADGGGKALANDDGISLAVLEPLDANLLLFAADGAARRAGNGDIGGKIGLSRERLRELETDARRRRIIVDLIIQDAKAVFLAQIFVNLVAVDIVMPIEAGAIGVDRRAPHFPAHEEIAQHRQRFGLGPRRGEAFIGGISGGRAAFAQFIAIGVLRLVRFDRDARQLQPVGGVLWIAGDGGGGELAGQFEIAIDVFGDRGGLLAQLLRALAFDQGG